MLRRTSFVVDTVLSKTTKKASIEPKEKKWVVLEDENGKKYIARVDNSTKQASKYKDFDEYIRLIYPKEYASEYIKDEHGKTASLINSNDFGKKIAKKLSSKISNLINLENTDLVVLGVDILNTYGIDPNTKQAASFVSEFVKSVRNADPRYSVYRSVLSHIKRAERVAVNPYRHIAENLLTVFGKEVVSTAIRRANEEKETELKDDIFDEYVECEEKELLMSEDDFESFKEGYVRGFNNSVLPEDAKGFFIIGYFLGKEDLVNSEVSKLDENTKQALAAEALPLAKQISDVVNELKQSVPTITKEKYDSLKKIAKDILDKAKAVLSRADFEKIVSVWSNFWNSPEHQEIRTKIYGAPALKAAYMKKEDFEFNDRYYFDLV